MIKLTNAINGLNTALDINYHSEALKAATKSGFYEGILLVHWNDFSDDVKSEIIERIEQITLELMEEQNVN